MRGFSGVSGSGLVLGLLGGCLGGCGSDSTQKGATDDSADGGVSPEAEADGGAAGGGQEPDAASPGGADADTPSTGAPALPHSVSGTRLRVTWLGAGEEAIPWETRDTELDAQCSFSLARDETLRCLPDGNRVLFADEDCTDPLLAEYTSQPCPSPSPEYGRLIHIPESCDEVRTVRVFEAGAAVETPAMVYESDDGECTGRAPEEGESFLSAEEMEPEEFVLGEELVDPRGGGVGVRWTRSSDGGWFPLGMQHLGRNENCVPAFQGPVTDRSFHCIVNPAYSNETGSYGFEDDGCSQPIAKSFNTCTEPEVVQSFEEDEDGCPDSVLRELGAPLSEAYGGTAEMCSELDEELTPMQSYFSVGDTVEDLITLTRGPASDESRLALLHYFVDGEPVRQLNTFWDSELELECFVTPFEGEQYACVPSNILNIAGNSSQTFQDAECTQAIVPGHEPSCGASPPAFIILQSEDSCSGDSARVFEIGPRHTNEMIYVEEGGDCFESSISPGSIWFERGPELVLEDTFQILTLSSD